MKFQVAVVILTTLLIVAAQNQTEQDSGTFALVNLGSVDGKNYFYDNAVHRNWFEARDFCIESGMTLATVETTSQAAFLKSKYNSSTFRSVHWTAARDAQIARQFTWDHTGTAPTDSIGIGWATHGDLDYQTCVYYFADPTPEFRMRSCALGTGYTLCET